MPGARLVRAHAEWALPGVVVLLASVFAVMAFVHPKPAQAQDSPDCLLEPQPPGCDPDGGGDPDTSSIPHLKWMWLDYENTPIGPLPTNRCEESMKQCTSNEMCACALDSFGDWMCKCIDLDGPSCPFLLCEEDECILVRG